MGQHNKLDNKVIISKAALRGLWEACPLADFEDEVPQALAADLTGWAVAPVEATHDMLRKARQYRNILEPWASAYRAMLEASPSLPGGGE